MQALMKLTVGLLKIDYGSIDRLHQEGCKISTPAISPNAFCLLIALSAQDQNSHPEKHLSEESTNAVTGHLHIKHN